MSDSVIAVFDGQAFHPTQPILLQANTRVWITIEPITEQEPPASFLQTAQSLQLEGPPDWATNLDQYLYGIEPGEDG